MGFYIDPEEGTKEKWLEANARPISGDEVNAWYDFTHGEELPVVLVDNGLFAAAAILFSSGERDDFMDKADKRLKEYYAASKEKLATVNLQFQRFLLASNPADK